jgi:hydrogenase maturation protein HypF
MIACDLHPDYMSTNYAEETARIEGIPLVYVQHHHAHMASCMADNNIYNNVIGIIWDGTGYGIDSAIWGGEFLVGGYKGFTRLASIRPISLPGGDRAEKDIYRIGYSLIDNALGDIPDDFKVTSNWKDIVEMMKIGLNSPGASSIGRLFDGVAAILGLRTRVSYEGQGAVILESMAADIDDVYDFDIYDDNGLMVYDWRSMIESIIRDKRSNNNDGIIAAKFMNTLVDMAVRISSSIRDKTKLNDIVLSGGVFQNIYVLKKLKLRLETENFNVYVHSRVSANDEGISLGQSMIAANGGGKYVSCSTPEN